MTTENNNWNTKIDTTQLPTAQQNMDYDLHLVNSLPINTTIERWYEWPTPGITFSYKQECPTELRHIDHGKRATGGGIVCHSPGDIVFSQALWRTAPTSESSLINTLAKVSNQIQAILNKKDIPFELQNNPSTSSINHHYCSSYPTPFEILINNQKRCGLTIRRFKDRCLIQGVLHCATSHTLFSEVIPNSHQFNASIPLQLSDCIGIK